MSREPRPDPLAPLAWPAEDAGRALAALAGRCLPSGVTRSADDAPPLAPPGAVAAEDVEADYRDVAGVVSRLAPGLIRLTLEGRPHVLAVSQASRRRLVLLAPDLSMASVDTADICARLCEGLERPLLAELDEVLARAGVPPHRRARARRALLRERLGARRIGGLTLLRPSPESSLWHQARVAGLHRRLAALLLSYAAYYVLWVASWAVIGIGALDGQLASGWLVAWALALFTLVPLRCASTWHQGALAIGLGGLLKRRLLAGAMDLETDLLRRSGAGRWLGLVMESSEFESLSLGGGIAAGVAVIELGVASLLMAAGAAGGVLLSLLAITAALVAALFVATVRRTGAWADARVRMTNDLVENMVGHRTRLAQEAPHRWHLREDRQLGAYAARVRALDRCALGFAALPRLWLLAGLAALGHAFTFADPARADLAIGLGAVLLGYRAIQRMAAGLRDLTRAASAWRQLRGLVATPLPTPEDGAAHATALAAAPDDRGLIDARGLCLRHAAREHPVLSHCSLRVERGGRILLQGASGSGKSTLASVLAGLRATDAGLLLLDGLDAPSWGRAQWRRRVVMAPQFGDNHIFMGSFAFNLLMGRRWPPTPEDMRAAREVCGALGLDDLLRRMPGGMMQLVGDTGWQLSHGEKSRVHVARALLQDPDLLILDESFAALDPENAARTMDCVLGREPALLVIAHP